MNKKVKIILLTFVCGLVLLMISVFVFKDDHEKSRVLEKDYQKSTDYYTTIDQSDTAITTEKVRPSNPRSETETAEEHGDTDNASAEFDYEFLLAVALENGYGNGTYLEKGDSECELLLYNIEDTIADCKKVTVNRAYEIVSSEIIALNSALKGYNFTAKFGDFSNQKYILGHREKWIGDTSYANIVCIPKDDLSQIIVFEEYISKLMAQNTYPTIIDFTLDISGDYIIYQDEDKFWKVRDIKSGQVFASTENEVRTSEMEQIANWDTSEEMIENKIAIFKFTDNNDIFVFDIDKKEFSRIPIN